MEECLIDLRKYGNQANMKDIIWQICNSLTEESEFIQLYYSLCLVFKGFRARYNRFAIKRCVRDVTFHQLINLELQWVPGKLLRGKLCSDAPACSDKSSCIHLTREMKGHFHDKLNCIQFQRFYPKATKRIKY